MTIRLDRVQRALVAALRYTTEADAVLWAPAQYPRRALGSKVVTAKMVRGPLIQHASKYYQDEPTRLTWSISSAVDNDRVGLAATGARWTHDVVPGQSISEVRDALLSQFTSEVLPGVEVSSSGSGSIRFNASGVPGLLWRPAAIGSNVTVTEDATLGSEVTTAPGLCTIEIQTYAAGRAVESMSLLSKFMGALGSTNLVSIFDALGVSVLGPAGEPIDLTAVAGAEWESRAMARLTTSIRSYYAAAIDTIETVAITANTDLAGAVATAEASI